MMHWGDYGWGMGVGGLFMIFFWALGILGLVYLGKLVAERGARNGKESALDILKKRYAKGEITKEEYERMKDDIKKQ